MAKPQPDRSWQILVSEETDPAINLALEEWLFSQVIPAKPLLLVYRNRPSVICGRFQNPWLEADVAWLAAQGVPLLRRLSGGRTVWHDEGNWNWSFMSGLDDFDQIGNLRLLSSWLQQATSLQTEINDRGDLLRNGKKISGNAMIKQADRVLHHCSLLVDADLTRLRRALTKPDYSGWRVTTRSVASVSASVTRLVDECAGLRPSILFDWMIQAAETRFGVNQASLSGTTVQLPEQLDPIVARYRNWDWNFARTPPFQLNPIVPTGKASFNARIDWPDIQLDTSTGGTDLPG